MLYDYSDPDNHYQYLVGIGVASYRSCKNDDKNYSIFTRVDNFKSWIHNQIVKFSAV